MLQGIILTCMLILPAAGASLVSDCQGDGPFCDPQEEYVRSLDYLYSSNTIPSIQTGESWTTSQGVSDTITSAPFPHPSTQGTISAWANQNTLQGNTNGVVTNIEYHQKVTATGQIKNFFFSVSCIL